MQKDQRSLVDRQNKKQWKKPFLSKLAINETKTGGISGNEAWFEDQKGGAS